MDHWVLWEGNGAPASAMWARMRHGFRRLTAALVAMRSSTYLDNKVSTFMIVELGSTIDSGNDLRLLVHLLIALDRLV